jgi:tRNA(adenine34) deaminase
MRWHELSAPWQAAFSQAWEAYCGGSIPIGAALADEHDVVISQGRSRQYEKSAPQGHICWSKLSHAELNALLQVSGHDHPNIRGCALYTTVEPCPLCFGALVMSNVRTLHYAARDGWAGSAAHSATMPFIVSKNLNVEGPLKDLGGVSAVLHTERALRLGFEPGSRLIAYWKDDYPAAVSLGQQWYHDGTLADAASGGRDAAWVFDATSRALEALEQPEEEP